MVRIVRDCVKVQVKYRGMMYNLMVYIALVSQGTRCKSMADSSEVVEQSHELLQTPNRDTTGQLSEFRYQAACRDKQVEREIITIIFRPRF